MTNAYFWKPRWSPSLDLTVAHQSMCSASLALKQESGYASVAPTCCLTPQPGDVLNQSCAALNVWGQEAVWLCVSSLLWPLSVLVLHSWSISMTTNTHYSLHWGYDVSHVVSKLCWVLSNQLLEPLFSSPYVIQSSVSFLSQLDGASWISQKLWIIKLWKKQRRFPRNTLAAAGHGVRVCTLSGGSVSPD